MNALTKNRKKLLVLSLLLVVLAFAGMLLVSNNQAAEISAYDLDPDEYAVTFSVTAGADIGVEVAGQYVLGSSTSIEYYRLKSGIGAEMRIAERGHCIFDSFTITGGVTSPITVTASPLGTGLTYEDGDGTWRYMLNYSQFTGNINIHFNVSKIAYPINASAVLLDTNGSSTGNAFSEAEYTIKNGSLAVSTIQLNDVLTISIRTSIVVAGQTYKFENIKISSNISGAEALTDGVVDGDYTVFTYAANFFRNLVSSQMAFEIGYIEAFTVSVSNYSHTALPGYNFVEIETFDPITGLWTSHDVISNTLFIKGSSVRVVVKTPNHFTFHGLTVNAAPFAGSVYASPAGGLNANLSVSASFSINIYSIRIKGLDAYGMPVSADDAVTVKMNNATGHTSTIKVGDVMNDIMFSSLSDYRFNGFSIKQRSADAYDGFTINTPINNAFFKNYLTANGEVTIIVHLIKQYSLNVFVVSDEKSSDWGFFTVSTVNGDVQKKEYDSRTDNISVLRNLVFDGDAKIYISATAKPYYTFSGFTLDFEETDRYNDELRFDELKYSRSIGVHFAKEAFDVKVNNTFDGKDNANDALVVRNNEKVSLGDIITITANLASSRRIKSWTINKDINLENLPSNMKYENGILSITLTEEWLDASGLEVNVNVTSGLKTGVLLAIILPSALVPLFVVAFVIVFIMYNKRKKEVKAQLTEQQAANYRLNTGGFVSDLKEGKDVGQVTDAKVKQEMKNQKHNKNK